MKHIMSSGIPTYPLTSTLFREPRGIAEQSVFALILCEGMNTKCYIVLVCPSVHAFGFWTFLQNYWPINLKLGSYHVLGKPQKPIDFMVAGLDI